MKRPVSAIRTTIKIHDTYVWGGDKDPVIDEMRTALEDSGLKESFVCDVAGISRTTAHNWFGGKTRRPQTDTSSAFMGALGLRRRWVRDVETEALVAKIIKRKKLT